MAGIRVPDWLHLRLVEEQMRQYRIDGSRPSLASLLEEMILVLEGYDPAAAYAPVSEGESAPASEGQDADLRRMDMDEAEYNMVKPMLDLGIGNVSDEDKLRVAEYERTHLTDSG